MHTLWHFILWCLACWSHDPASLAAERARCAGCVVVAYAALAVEPPPPPAPRREPETTPAPAKQPCPQCHDTGRIYRSDGGWVKCQCKPCPTGRCPTAR
jgi:hypothetical protein